MPPSGRQSYENQGNANAHYQQGYDSGRGQSRPRYDIHHFVVEDMHLAIVGLKIALCVAIVEETIPQT